MPLCEGRPDGPCPDRRNDSSVRLTQGDLMLCSSCDEFRFPSTYQPVRNTTNASRPITTPATTTSKVPAAVASTTRNMEVNELLCFISSKFDNYPPNVIKKAIADFCREDEIVSAKQMLVQAVGLTGLDIQQFAKNRIGTNKNKSMLDDIFNIWSAVDDNGLLDKLPTFCAASLSRIPVLTDEISDITLIKKIVVELQDQVRVLSDSLTAMRVENSQMRAGTSDAVPTCCSIGDNGNLAAGWNNEDAFTTGNVNNDNSSHALSATQVSVDHTRSNSMSTYAAAAKKPPQDVDGEGFQTVTGKRQKDKQKRKFVVGNCRQNEQLQGVSRRSVFCINRLKSGTTTDAVTEYLSSQNIEVSSCYIVQPSGHNPLIRNDDNNDNTDDIASENDHNTGTAKRGFITMRLCLLNADKRKILAPELWPVGVTVRPWVFKSEQHQRN